LLTLRRLKEVYLALPWYREDLRKYLMALCKKEFPHYWEGMQIFREQIDRSDPSKNVNNSETFHDNV